MRRARAALLGPASALALLLAGLVTVPAAGAATAPLPSYLAAGPGVRQLVTVTSSRWSDTRASLSAWERDGSGWHRVRGPVRVRLGWNGWVRAGQRRQNTGTTPAGRFTLPAAFGNRADPGARLPYTHVDPDDVWPYEPRDPATYNAYQPSRAAGSHWRADYHERLASYGYEYAHAVVLGFNLPGGVHWSRPAPPVRRRRDRPTPVAAAGSSCTCSAAATPPGASPDRSSDVRWLVRWLDPSAAPRIVMGPTAWVKRTF